jgi:two-component system OmpR family response regulator
MEKNLKALIVDDEADVCYLLGGILTYKHLQVSFASSLLEAKTVLSNEKPSVIFLDNHLPDGFGLDYIEELKALLPDVKIIMITAHDTAADRLKAKLKGADSFIGKPFTKDLIFGTLENLFLNRLTPQL